MARFRPLHMLEAAHHERILAEKASISVQESVIRTAVVLRIQAIYRARKERQRVEERRKGVAYAREYTTDDTRAAIFLPRLVAIMFIRETRKRLRKGRFMHNHDNFLDGIRVANTAMAVKRWAMFMEVKKAAAIFWKIHVEYKNLTYNAAKKLQRWYKGIQWQKVVKNMNVMIMKVRLALQMGQWRLKQMLETRTAAAEVDPALRAAGQTVSTHSE